MAYWSGGTKRWIGKNLWQKLLRYTEAAASQDNLQGCSKMTHSAWGFSRKEERTMQTSQTKRGDFSC
jgi:hypothetical protein